MNPKVFPRVTQFTTRWKTRSYFNDDALKGETSGTEIPLSYICNIGNNNKINSPLMVHPPNDVHPSIWSHSPNSIEFAQKPRQEPTQNSIIIVPFTEFHCQRINLRGWAADFIKNVASFFVNAVFVDLFAGNSSVLCLCTTCFSPEVILPPKFDSPSHGNN